MWYNITIGLRVKIGLLGRTLFVGLGPTEVPWPDLNLGATSRLAHEVRIASIVRSSPKVRFSLGELHSGSGTAETSVNESQEVVEEPLPPPPGGFCPLGSTPKGLKEAAVALLSSTSNKSIQMSSRKLSDSSLMLHSESHSPYRPYVEKLLKTLGQRKTLDQLRKIFQDSLGKVYDALPHDINFSAVDIHAYSRENSFAGLSTSPSSPQVLMGFGTPESGMNTVPSSDGMENALGQPLSISSLGLPSFKPVYLFLCRIPLDIMYECLSSKLDHQPQKPPSPLSLRQLLYECKETISGAVMIRQRFLHFATPAYLDASDADIDFHIQEIERFDAHAKRILIYYLDYLCQWVLLLLRDKSGGGLGGRKGGTGQEKSLLD
ncbi:unnamed protein product, partial [Notodromas monacha]